MFDFVPADIIIQCREHFVKGFLENFYERRKNGEKLKIVEVPNICADKKYECKNLGGKCNEIKNKR